MVASMYDVIPLGGSWGGIRLCPPRVYLIDSVDRSGQVDKWT